MVSSEYDRMKGRTGETTQSLSKNRGNAPRNLLSVRERFSASWRGTEVGDVTCGVIKGNTRVQKSPLNTRTSCLPAGAKLPAESHSKVDYVDGKTVNSVLSSP